MSQEVYEFTCHGCDLHHTVKSKECPKYCLRTGTANQHEWEADVIKNIREPSFEKKKPQSKYWQRCGQLVRFENHIGEIETMMLDGSCCTVHFFDGYKTGKVLDIIPVEIQPWDFDNAPLHFKTNEDMFYLMWNMQWGYQSCRTMQFLPMEKVALVIDKFGRPCGKVVDLPMEEPPEDEDDWGEDDWNEIKIKKCIQNSGTHNSCLRFGARMDKVFKGDKK